jgi:AraC-like DNA-binding protein
VSVTMETTRVSPALVPYISAYFRLRFDYPHIEEIERADVGYLRFTLQGTGYYEYAPRERYYDCPATILGPSTKKARYALEGPLESFGCVLGPAFWGGIIAGDAHHFANRVTDAAQLLGPEIHKVTKALAQAGDTVAMAATVDAFLIERIKPLPADHALAIAAISHWLSQDPTPPPEVLYGACAQSSRQVMRYANRFFGAPPKMLARKFRALRTASRIVGTRGRVPETIVADYSDRAHMSREVKHFTGVTPRGLQINSSPIMQISLEPANFRAIAPWACNSE